ncbi:MAG: phospholipase D family protein [Nocardioidaceae bacterium]
MSTDWLLEPHERGNSSTEIDRRHRDGKAWTTGNDVTPLIHGRTYFAELAKHVTNMQAGDLLMFTDWRGDPDQRVDDDGEEVGQLFCAAAQRGVTVKGLVWRSHVDKLSFSEQENRHLGEEIESAGGECVRDMRVRPGGSHHQKFVVLRHAGRPHLDLAFVGGIDLCHSRFDDAGHAGDPQRQPMAAAYGDQPPWHDIQLELRGPAVGDVETVFRERWEDPTPLTRNPVDWLSDRIRREDTTPNKLPARTPDPAPCGHHTVQLLRTYPYRRHGYPFAPDGERSVARAYCKTLPRARRLIYVEDQYFWSVDVIRYFADAMRDSPALQLIVVIPHHPDQDGRLSMPPNLVGRQQAIDLLNRAAPGRFGIYGLENHAGTPVYVHAKVCVIDDTWTSVGSDNINRRSWSHDSELACAVTDDDSTTGDDNTASVPAAGPSLSFGAALRLQLACEHLDRDPGDDADLLEPEQMFSAFADSARHLQHWYDTGRSGARPPGRIRPYHQPRLDAATLAWATPLYKTIYDPDGRPGRLRRAGQF